ncbi:hypothetical protein N7510_005071 [Penicillium lagena]|uniref:uncharacterized protein n=1 Tax=Penicillium lagena TaxID=94218 RepID=UPI00254195A7|nr:uncharacterized protein N7510_005071 [Penicillium lagena]KAJ5621087.1 hypothetical protein N7510_005071 [Penicillium lagena]
MHAKQLLALGGLVLASNVVIAAKLEHDDVPNHCWPACGPVVGISESCDHQHDNDDSAELQCICNWGPASTQIPLCAACITQYGHDDDHDHDHDYGHDNDDDNDNDDDDNEALDLVNSCSFSTTTYNAAAATTLSSNSAAAATATTTDSNGSGQNSAGSSTTGSTPTTTNAAAGLSIPGVAPLAAVVGMMPLALL